MITNPEYHIDNFLKILRECQNLQNVKSVLLSGSSKNSKERKSNDIDLMIICEVNSAKLVYKELKQKLHNVQLRRILDVKIIEISQIDNINNSASIPFFYHFFKNSHLLYGLDLADRFVLRKNWVFHSIISFLEKLDIAEKVFFEYKQYKEAEIILYEIGKRFSIIYELAFEEGIIQNQRNITDSLISIFGKEYLKMRKKITKEKSWISLYEEKSSKGIFGFDVLKIRKAREPVYLDNIRKERFETWTKKIKNLAGKCLEYFDM